LKFIFFYNSGCVRTPKNLKSPNEDDDVAAERQRIYSDRDNTTNDVLRMVDLVKVKHKQTERIFENFYPLDLWIDIWKEFSCG